MRRLTDWYVKQREKRSADHKARQCVQRAADQEVLRRYSYHPQRPCIPLLVYVAACMWLGIMVFMTWYEPRAAFIEPHHMQEPLTVCMVEDARVGFYGAHGYARVLDGPYKGQRVAYFCSPDMDETHIPRACETYVVDASFIPVKEHKRMDYVQHGCLGGVRITQMYKLHDHTPWGVVSDFRTHALERVHEVLPQASMGRALVLALLFGDRTELEYEGLYDAIKALGLAHLVAVSGAHLSIVTGVVALVLYKTPLNQRCMVACLCICMAAYVVMTGCGPSVIRSAVMALFGFLAVCFKRRTFTLSSLAACVVVMLAVDPTNAFSLSFTLSVLSTLGIVIFTPLFSSWLGTCMGRRYKTIRDMVAMTCAANLITLPLSCALFGRIPLMSVCTNIGASVFLGIFLPCALVIVLVGVSIVPLCSVLCLVAVLPAQMFCAACVWISGWPGVSAPVTVHPWAVCGISIIAVTVLWVWWPELTRKHFIRGCVVLTLGVVCLVAVWLVSAEDKVVVLDVGQGDAILVQSQGSTVLIDTGRNDAMLLQALARHHVYNIDALIITHHDEDHYGSLPALRGTVGVDAIYVAHDALFCDCLNCRAMYDAITAITHTQLRQLSVGDVLQVGAIELKTLWPYEYTEEGGNQDSICMVALYDGNHDGVSDTTTFLGGDAEKGVMQELINRGVLGDIDIYKIGHHGSKNALTEEQAEVLLPEVSIVSAGAHNRYGHPSDVTMEILSNVDSVVYRTDTNGDVSCIMKPDGVRIETLR